MITDESQVQVEVLDVQGNSEWLFTIKEWQSFAQWAEDAGISLPVSCCSGACFVCACQVKEWLDNVDIGLLQVPLVDIEDDQVLTCVWWVKSQLFHDGQFHKIVLQKIL